MPYNLFILTSSVVAVNSQKRKIRALFLSSPNDASNTCIVERRVGFGFNADGFKKTNPIKITIYRTILSRLISGDLLSDISNVGCFFAANDMGERFPHIVSAAGKKRDIGRYLGGLDRYLNQELICVAYIVQALSRSSSQQPWLPPHGVWYVKFGTEMPLSYQEGACASP